MKLAHLSISLLLAFTTTPAFAEEEIRMATLELPPFFSDEMPDQGAAAHGLKEMFKSIGYKLDFEFYPARRAKSEVLKNSRLSGYIPCSKYDVIPGLIMSDTIFYTNTILVERKDKPITWQTPRDLKALRGSLGRGYSLKGPMHTAFTKGQIKVEEVPDDVSGILKVANGRADYHFMADGMFKYLILQDPRLKEVAPLVQANSKPAARVGWGGCFKEKSASSMKALKAFNANPNKKDFPESVVNYLKKRDKE